MECPSVWVYLMFLTIGFTLCLLGRNITERLLCDSQWFWSGGTRFWLVPLLVMFILVIKMLITMLSPGWKLVLYSGKQYLQSNIGLLDVTAPRPSQWTELENIFMFMHHKHTPILYIYIYSDSSVYQSING